MRYGFHLSINHIIPVYLKRFKICISEYFVLSLASKEEAKTNIGQ